MPYLPSLHACTNLLPLGPVPNHGLRHACRPQFVILCKVLRRGCRPRVSNRGCQRGISGGSSRTGSRQQLSSVGRSSWTRRTTRDSLLAGATCFKLCPEAAGLTAAGLTDGHKGYHRRRRYSSTRRYPISGDVYHKRGSFCTEQWF